MKCRHCASPLEHTVLDLGFAPPSNAYLTLEDLTQPEKYYPPVSEGLRSMLAGSN